MPIKVTWMSAKLDRNNCEKLAVTSVLLRYLLNKIVKMMCNRRKV